jgi:hypothetical protein
MFLTHVGSESGDYQRRKKISLLRQVARKSGVKNLLKTRSTQPSEKGIQSGLECGESPKLAEKFAVLADPF